MMPCRAHSARLPSPPRLCCFQTLFTVVFRQYTGGCRCVFPSCCGPCRSSRLPRPLRRRAFPIGPVSPRLPKRPCGGYRRARPRDRGDRPRQGQVGADLRRTQCQGRSVNTANDHVWRLAHQIAVRLCGDAAGRRGQGRSRPADCRDAAATASRLRQSRRLRELGATSRTIRAGARSRRASRSTTAPASPISISSNPTASCASISIPARATAIRARGLSCCSSRSNRRWASKPAPR